MENLYSKYKIIADYHTHTMYSHGKGSIEDNVKKAIEKGLKSIAITDHGSKHFIFGVSEKKLLKQKEEIQAISKKYPDFQLLFGVESNITGIDEVYAKQMPEDKINNLVKIREKHGAVMFTGDGINDAPVLAGADVGAAMGNGADAAIEAADVVFMNPGLGAVPESIRIAKETKRIAMENVIGALVIKAAVMVLGFAGIASMWMAVFADSGVAMLCVVNSIRILFRDK